MQAETNGEASESWYVQSLDRGLAVLRCFSAERPALKMAEVAQLCGLSRAAARRFLLTLEHLGYVTAQDGRWRLRPAVLEIGYAYLSAIGLDRLLQPELDALCARTGETCSFGVLDGDCLLMLARAQTQRLVRTQIGIGSRLPLHVTSMGKTLLAHLPLPERDALLARLKLTRLTASSITEPALLRSQLETVRGLGWALAVDELEDGHASMALPVRDADGRVIAALNASFYSGRSRDAAALDALRRTLAESADRLGRIIAANPALGSQLAAGRGATRG